MTLNVFVCKMGKDPLHSRITGGNGGITLIEAGPQKAWNKGQLLQ